MIPTFDVGITSSLPDNAEFWVPTSEDLEDEGIGYFRDKWPILDVSVDDAMGMLRLEVEILDVVSSLVADPSEYEVLAHAVEAGSLNDVRDRFDSRPEWPRLQELVDDESSPLEGLDLGVSGLVHALVAAGLITAASCRGHHLRDAWSPYPVVYFATNRSRAEVLQPLVVEAGCGFDVDESRRELILVYSSSVENFVRLAHLILAGRDRFGVGSIVRDTNFDEGDHAAVVDDPNQLYLPGFGDPSLRP
ncbi:hypothetical protein LZG04_34920 [Saccharothrix sp. S26]|uniref:hypothetical protein n=1 Tax=Saccharothrix sp. S26 TaxID=2907215 RepID=UPI001F33F38A|nr:hypothetical protein [Saccharothrix sp. S26]MCE6999971.1 hypothetical protein [Saccharothrix sp. S26]